MRRIAIALALVFAAPALGADGPAARINARIAQVETLFEQGRYDEAFALTEALYAEHPGLPPVQFLAGKAKFYQQDYAGAVALLQRATLGEASGADAQRLLDRARDTLELTKDYATHRGEHFVIRVPAGVDEVLFPYAVEALDAAWKNLGADFDYHPSRPIVVEAYETAEQLSRASGLPVNAIKNSGTIAICKHNKLMFTSPKALLRGYEWLDTLSHEYVHYVVSRVSNNTVPIWLHEGIAKYQETRWSGAPGRALSPWSEKLLAEAVSGKRKFITFEEMSPSMALLPTQEDTSLAFAEVFSVVEFIVTEKGGYPALRKMIDGLESGLDDDEAVAASLGMPFDAFEAAWKAWLKRRPMRTDSGTGDERLVFKDDVKGKVVESADDEVDAGTDLANSEAKRYAHLGELLRARGRFAAAAVEYEKAYAATGPKAPLLSNKLALTYLRLERYDRAEELLKASLVNSPTFVTTHVNLGMLYRVTGRLDLAEAAFRRAIEINPFDPRIHVELYAIFKKTGRVELAKQEAKALALLEGRRRGGAARTAAEGDAGHLSLHSTPWARVEIDGKDTGLTTPLFRYALPAGTHEVRLVAPHEGGDKTLSVEITAGEEEKLEVSLP